MTVVPPTGRSYARDLPYTLPNPHSDIDFISALILELGAVHGIDQSRVYAMGYSNGGGFVYDLACRLNNQITGVGCFSTMYAVFELHHISPYACRDHFGHQ